MASKASGGRRLLSLCFLLALVILLMQQAADPKNVSNTFRALGVPLEEEPLQPDTQTTSSTIADDRGAASQSRWTATCKDLVPRLLANATPQQVNAIGNSWFKLTSSSSESASSPNSMADLESLYAETLNSLDALAESFESDSSDWNVQLTRFRDEWQSCWTAFQHDPQPSKAPTETIATAVSVELASAVSEFLDDRLLATLDDAAPWTRSEATCFWRLLQRGQGRGRGNRGDQLSADSPLISTQQLEAEADYFKGRNIRFRGTVRRVERIERGKPSFGVDGYWLIWMRGEDASTQPVAVYSTASNVRTIAERLNADNEAYPEIELTAVPAKRLAYSSQSGILVAPTLFASRISPISSRPPSLTNTNQKKLISDLTIALLAGGILAGIILLPMLAHFRRKESRADSRISRRVRTKLILIWFALSLGENTSSVAQDSTPPWAKSDSTDSQRANLLETRLAPALTPESIGSCKAFLQGESDTYPDALLKALHNLDQLVWNQSLPSTTNIAVASEIATLSSVQMTGIVHLAMPVQLSEDQSIWFQRSDQDQVFRLELELRPDLFQTSNSTAQAPPELDTSATVKTGQLVSVFCRHVPSQWQVATQLRQPVTLDAFALVERGNTQAPPKLLCGLAKEVNWIIPDHTEIDLLPHLPEHLLTLGRLQWNLQWVDEVAFHNQKALRSSEAAAFYSLLKTLDTAEAISQYAKISLKDASPLDLLSEPKQSVGRRILWPVRLVTGSVVQVESLEDQARLGADHYFQFDGFVDIGNQRIRYQVADQAAGAEIVFEREFPITIVMKGETPFVSQAAKESSQLSWDVGKYVQVDGCFYRLWSYESELMERKNTGARQAAPLIIATQLTPTTPPIRGPQGEIGWFGYALCLAILVILAAVLYLTLKRDRAPRRASYRR